ncbi:FadR/GntR family transcriptional regulator [Pseudonocardia spinosispora]|uniref:FadR/GntR family transcriptional regulator n=1 Tax=Pseudonocardia spinosispora TaxID=103441 RepID=UPI000A05EC9E|nr:GntR family transcriptional regulator [Pseudonocardia spinosispora]
MARDAASREGDHRIGRARIADRIVDDLRERILSGTLPHGSRLPAERELAEQYGVSGATIREAVRVLAAVGLVSVRHGIGSFVTANSDTMIGMSIAAVVRLHNIGATEVLGVLAALNRYAAQLAAHAATDAEIASLREIVEKLAVADTIDRTNQMLKAFMRRLSEISHNALLIGLCRYMIDVQIELIGEIASGHESEWRRVVRGLHPDRLAVIEALESRSSDRVAKAVDALGAHTAGLVMSTPWAEKMQLSDPGYAHLLASLLTTNPSSAIG